MLECEIYLKGQYDLYCAVHDRSDRECYQERISKLELQVEVARKYVDLYESEMRQKAKPEYEGVSATEKAYQQLRLALGQGIEKQVEASQKCEYCGEVKPDVLPCCHDCYMET